MPFYVTVIIYNDTAYIVFISQQIFNYITDTSVLISLFVVY